MALRLLVRSNSTHLKIHVYSFISLIPLGDSNGSQNILNMFGSGYVLRGFDIHTGSAGIRVMDGSYGVFLMTTLSTFFSQFVGTFEQNRIHGVREVTFTMNIDGNDYHHFNVIDNEIYGACGTGEGMYIGYVASSFIISLHFSSQLICLFLQLQQ